MRTKWKGESLKHDPISREVEFFCEPLKGYVAEMVLCGRWQEFPKKSDVGYAYSAI